MLEFNQLLQEDGVFSYTEKGFTIKGDGSHKWADIAALFGCKNDRLQDDEISLDLFFKNGKCMSITESTGGWFKFLKALHTHIPGVDPNWDMEIANSHVKTNLTLLFDRAGRSSAEAEKLYYA
ncbi:hypothetical protein LX64_04938 [Chitinophaga skermanii]|uniref:Uncharacterized protein n=1 Tax=Chitinophaga skermanii TaxID=331697 RepID=A0A327Q0H7_9BACT|nr:hypothetical protein [Chitinophaga skermanii]RAI97888.1 hypothetical protein LX64_04938 [Chitinophaga skermanii]